MLLPSAPNKQISSERPSVYMARLKEQYGAAAFDEILASFCRETRNVPDGQDFRIFFLTRMCAVWHTYVHASQS